MHLRNFKKMKFNRAIIIQDTNISIKSPTFIIAEAGVNHGGDIAIAKQLIDIAVDAKADAVKFQSFRAENIVLNHIDKAPYQKKTTNKN